MLPQRENLEDDSKLNEKNQDRQDATNTKGPESGLTQIPNAHAAGLGTMGRNDEKLPSPDDNDEETEMENEDPVY